MLPDEGEAVVRRVRDLVGGLFGARLAPRARALRIVAALCFGGALLLVAVAGTLILQSARQPHLRALPVGTVFSAAVTPAPVRTPLSLSVASPTPAPTTTVTDTPTEAPPPSPSPSPEPSPTPPPDDAPVARLAIPAIHVDAPVSDKGVDAQGVMQDPNGPDDVAYYTFSGKPGFGPGNNAVFGGHVDYYPHRTAVFWDLDKLKPGDEVDVRLQDGTVYSYRVTDAVVYPADSAPVQQILADTPQESVTLITCNGTFSGGGYNNRLVVRAQRTDAGDAQTGQAGG
jgi:LPXTG-site transpeptidase (sortase) family protein